MKTEEITAKTPLELARKMAKAKKAIGTSDSFKCDPFRTHFDAFKSDKDSRGAGFIYGLEAIALRELSGDTIEKWEIEVLVAKAKALGIEKPKKHVLKALGIIRGLNAHKFNNK